MPASSRTGTALAPHKNARERGRDQERMSDAQAEANIDADAASEFEAPL